ncbi:MAG: hypothetical protein HYX29_04825 [Solirubrobacterales bacterium]|nr:hypothetical protein [Solirubrobacterales bacterium]
MKNNETTGESYQPNFELPKHGVVREENWSEFEAQGYVPDLFVTSVNAAQHMYGVQKGLPQLWLTSDV